MLVSFNIMWYDAFVTGNEVSLRLFLNRLLWLMTSASIFDAEVSAFLMYKILIFLR